MYLRRILVADDFAEWRVQVRDLLKVRPEWQIFEACDGGEAVQKATELQPDVVLLDVGMPNLSGIEAAPRICQASPRSKIIFLSQDGDSDVVEAALNTGAEAYLRKQIAGTELLPVIHAALRDGHPRLGAV